MSPARPPTASRRRRWAAVLALLLLALLAGAWWLARLLEPERLSAWLLQQASAASDLELALAEPADVGFWPDLHVELGGLRAVAPGAERPLLTVARVDLVLPWSALLDREMVIQRLRLVRPSLDRDALGAWLASRPPRPDTPFELPQLTASLQVEAGAVFAQDPQAWRLDELAIQTSSLLDGQPFHAQLQGLVRTAGSEQGLQVELATTPRTVEGVLSLAPLRVQLQSPELDQPLVLEGELQLQHPGSLALQLQGELQRWPAQWPPLPLPEPAPLALALNYEGPTDGSGNGRVRIRGGSAVVDASGSLREVLGWMDAGAGSPLPPLAAQLQAQRLQFGEVQLQGVSASLQPGDGAADAPAAAAEPSR